MSRLRLPSASKDDNPEVMHHVLVVDPVFHLQEIGEPARVGLGPAQEVASLAAACVPRGSGAIPRASRAGS